MAHNGQVDNGYVAKRTDPSVRLRLPKQVIKAITARARKNGRSRNSEIVVVLAHAAGLLGEQAQADAVKA